MKRFQLLIQKEPLVLPVVLLILGVLFGHIVFRILYSIVPDVIVKWNTSYVNVLEASDKGGFALCKSIFMKLAREVLIYFMMCLTILGIPYYTYCILNKSFQISFLVSCFVKIYASKGVFMAFCAYFPQMLFYLPASFLCIKYGWSLYNDVQCGRIRPNFSKNVLLKRYINQFLIILLLFAAGTALEVFVGRFIWDLAASGI